MSKKLNNKGFTLIEVLAVLVILIAIMTVAIPSISSSLERTKNKQNEARYEIIESATEQYVTDHKNAVYNNLGSDIRCYIQIKDVTTLTSEEMEDADGKQLGEHYVVFEKPSTYDFIEDGSKGDATISCID